MGQTILLIDDSAILRRIATNVLGGQGLDYEVITATRASEGFARACGTRPNLILVDEQLAGTGKAELCQRFLDEPRTAGVPVVLLLDRGAKLPPWSELPTNVVDTLSKPFTPEQLIAATKAIVGAAKENGNHAAIRAKLHGEPAEASLLVDRKAVTAAARQETPRMIRERTDAVSTAELRAGGRIHPICELPASARREMPVFSVHSEFLKITADKLSGVWTLNFSDEPLLNVFFDLGKLVVVTTRDATAYSQGAAGVLPAKVSPATLEGALDEQRHSGVPFILTLGARGLLSKASAVDLLHRFGQQFFSRLWGMHAPTMNSEFTRLDALPGFALRLEPRRESIENWLFATLRLLDESDLAAPAKHDGFVGTPTLTRDGQAMLSALKLDEQEREFSKRVNGRHDLPGIAKGMGISAGSAYLILYRFRALKAMDYRPAPAAYMVTPRTSIRRVLPLPR